MRRYYSHYTFIYPDLYLKNHVVELDKENRIVRFFPFEKEIESTEFYSGLILFLPIGKDNSLLVDEVKNKIHKQYLSQDNATGYALDITIKDILSSDR